MFFNRPARYTAPGGSYYKIYADMLQQPHLLIAGATGSGKSVVINGIIHTALLQGPDKHTFIFIDPKRVELSEYKKCPHCIRYASEPSDMVEALRYALALIETRYTAMQQQNERTFSGGDVYVIIDELADLMTTQARAVTPLLQRICQIGRAARVHVIAATQCPLSTVIPTPIKVNFDARVALRTRSAQDSRNIIGQAGCEQLPRYGQGYYITPEGAALYNIPMYDEAQSTSLIDYWTSKKCVA